METNKFDLLENIKISNDDREYFKYSDMVNEIIIQLITRRIELNISQRDLAEKTGIKQPMIARIEKFESVPRLDTIVKIAYALGLIVTFNSFNNNSNELSFGPEFYSNMNDNKYNNDWVLRENVVNYNHEKNSSKKKN